MSPGLRATLHEFSKGTLHSGSKSGPVVENPKQAIAIAMSEGRKAGDDVPPPKDHHERAKHHHTKAGEALEKKDHKTAMHHVGHMLAAMKRASAPDEEPAADEPSDTGDDEMAEDEGMLDDADEAMEQMPQKSSMRDRLKRAKK